MDKRFIISKVFSHILDMKSNCIGCTWHEFHVSYHIDGNTITTKVDDQEFIDALPMKGSRRDRKEIGRLVANHMCDTWGITIEEVTEYCSNFLTELSSIFEAHLSK